MRRRFRHLLIGCSLIGALLLTGCQLLRRAEPAPCVAAPPPPGALAPGLPTWRFHPNMWVWEAQFENRPGPVTIMNYSLKIANLSDRPARNVQVQVYTAMFGWQEAAFEYGKEPADQNCPELEPNQWQIWTWSRQLDRPEDPGWRPMLEESAAIRVTWQEEGGDWYRLEGRLPGQYAPAAYGTEDLTPFGQ